MKQILRTFIVRIITWEAKLVLKKYKPKIVAVTGNVGKTSTKDAIFTVLSRFYFVRKSEKSFNSDVGVPLTILGCPNGWSNPLIWTKNILEGLALMILPNVYPQWLVLEIGADRPGDIRGIAAWVIPDITVVTKLSKVPVHIEFFVSPEELFQEKGFLVRALKRDGVLVLNSDDEDVLAFRTLTEGKVLLYGFGNGVGPDILARQYTITYSPGRKREPTGVSFEVIIGDKKGKIQVQGALGRQSVYPGIAALAVAEALGLSFEKSIDALLYHEVSSGRMKIVEGVKHTTIVDDSYNSSPLALEEALKTLLLLRTKGRKIAVLGDMLELGKYSTDEHKRIGSIAAGVCDILITVGLRARFIAEGALLAGMDEANILQFDDSRVAGKELELMLEEHDVVLVKGSQGVRMEHVVREVMAHPEEKDKILVRQDKEWLGR